jgi:hypothetical protein
VFSLGFLAFEVEIHMKDKECEVHFCKYSQNDLMDCQAFDVSDESKDGNKYEGEPPGIVSSGSIDFFCSFISDDTDEFFIIYCYNAADNA